MLLLLFVRYFRAMANGEQPPVREDNENIRLTPGILRILNRQVGGARLSCHLSYRQPSKYRDGHSLPRCGA